MKVFDQANRKKVAMTEAFFKEIGQYLNINMKIPVSKLNITQKDHVYKRRKGNVFPEHIF